MRRPVFGPVVFSLATAALAVACQGGTSASAPADAVPASKAPEPSAEPDTPAAPDARVAAAEVEAAKKLERWTPELRAHANALRTTPWASTTEAMPTILASAHRMPGNADRDTWRHPAETLEFFGVTPASHVFEVGQGGGWYTELLAPLLAKQGQLYLAGYDRNSSDTRTQNAVKLTDLFVSGSANLYEDVELEVQPGGAASMGPAGSMDVVLVIRMMHNVHRFELWDGWMKAAHTSLKPGGVLGVVQHRAAADADPDVVTKAGYCPEPWLIERIESYGFKLQASSEINANPKDTKDHPGGVWSLPPTFEGGDKGRDGFAAIGESDRSTLKFVKVEGGSARASGARSNLG